jgi:hypothetical protein
MAAIARRLRNVTDIYVLRINEVWHKRLKAFKMKADVFVTEDIEMRGGAAGVMRHPSEELLRAVRTVCQGAILFQLVMHFHRIHTNVSLYTPVSKERPTFRKFSQNLQILNDIRTLSKKEE